MALDIVQHMLPTTSQWLEWSTRHPGWDELTTQTSDAMLITGKDNTMKTSLLFQAAVSYAAEGCHVTFVSRQPFSCLPRAVHGMPRPNPVIMKHLKMLYLTSYDDLIGYLTTMHQGTMVPSVIVIDDLHLFLHSDNCQESHQQQTVARLCALLVDTAQYLRPTSDATSAVLVSIQNTSITDPVLTTIQRFFKTTWHIHRTDDSLLGPNTNEYILQTTRNMSAITDTCQLLLTFTSDRAEIRLKQIQVEDVSDRS